MNTSVVGYMRHICLRCDLVRRIVTDLTEPLLPDPRFGVSSPQKYYILEVEARWLDVTLLPPQNEIAPRH